MRHLKRTKDYFISFILLFLSLPTLATQFEITPYVGKMFASNIDNSIDGSKLSLDKGTNYGISFAWQDTPNGQGQVLLNFVSHDFNSALDNQEHSLDIIYAHFSGVAQFRQQNYVTTFSLGLGGAYFDVDSENDLYPSLTAAIGTRYEFSDDFALVTELRGYMSLIKENEQLFCQDGLCAAQFNETLWTETTLSVGLAYSF